MGIIKKIFRIICDSHGLPISHSISPSHSPLPYSHYSFFNFIFQCFTQPLNTLFLQLIFYFVLLKSHFFQSVRSNHNGVFDTYLIEFKNTSLLMSVLQFESCIYFQHRQSSQKMEDLLYPLLCLRSYTWDNNPHCQIVLVN